MKQVIRNIVIGTVSIIVGYIIYLIIYDSIYMYSHTFFDYKPYFWIFSDSTQKGIDTLSGGGRIRKTDKLYTYVYYDTNKKKYYFAIWEIKALGNTNLDDIQIKQGIDLFDKKITSGTVLDVGSMAETSVKFGSFFKDSINIDLDDNSKIYKTVEGKNYRGFYGKIKKMAFKNEEQEYLVFIDYIDGATPTMLLLYKANSSFFIIHINADVPFDEKVISMLNLK